MSIKVDKEKSEQFRIQGNNSFKKGRWTEAIGHYTSATIHNPQDPTSYCNRAFAYLKLEKYNDAERDCSSALDIQKENIKALYRRGLARKGLERYDEALNDIEEVLRLDDTNALAIEEKEELGSLIKEKREQENRQRAKPKLPPSPPKSAYIEDLPPDDPVTSPEHDNERVVPSPSSTNTSSFGSLREVRVKRKTYISATPKVGAGTAEATASGIATQTESEAPLSVVSATAPAEGRLSSKPEPPKAIFAPSLLNAPRIPPPPINPSSTAPGSGLQLLQHLTNLPTPLAWTVLTHYPTEIIPTILSPILEPDSLGRLIEVLLFGVEKDIERVRGIMSGLKGRGRWGLNTMLLSKKEKEYGDQAWKLCDGEGEWR